MDDLSTAGPAEDTEAAAWAVQRRKVGRDALGVGAATGAYGLSFGAIATAAGLSVPQTAALSLLMFTGASQFALVGVLGAGGGPLAAAATATLLGSRNAFYGLRLSGLLRARGARRLLAAQLVIDESTAMAVAHEDERSARLAFWATGWSVFVLWNLATLLGAFGAQAFDDPRVLGLDAAAPAAFLALLAPRLRDREAWALAAAAAVLALVVTPGVPAGLPLLAVAAGTVVFGLWVPRGREAVVMWLAVLAGVAGCYLCKLAGLSVPKRVLDDPRTQRVAALLPVALLAALATVQTFSSGQLLVLDARAAAIGVAVLAIALRAPFLVVVTLAAATAALLRLLS